METIKKFLSRKFLVAIAALVVVVTGILRPGAEEQAQTISNTIVEGVLLLTPAFYVIAQGLVDKEEATKKKPRAN